MIRLSVTDLDSYLYWQNTDEFSFEDFLKRLRGQEPPSNAMLAGRALHLALETTHGEGEIVRTQCDGYTFVFAIDEEISMPMVRELKAEVRIETKFGPVMLVGKVDGMDGRVVRDYKLTERFEAERYADSYQWRAYLSMFNCGQFLYQVFQCRFDPETGKLVTIYDYHEMTMHAYPRMRADVEEVTADLAYIVKRWVPEKIREAA